MSPTRTPQAPTLNGPLSANTGATIYTGAGVPGELIFIRRNGGSIGSGTVGSNGTYSISLGTTLLAGDSMSAAAGSPAGPLSAAVIVGAAPVGPVAVPLNTVDIGATMIVCSGIPGAVISIILDPDGGGPLPPVLLGSNLVPSGAKVGVTLSQPLAAGQAVSIVSSGVPQGGTVAVSATIGQAPVLLLGSVLEEGSTLQGTGMPSATIHAVASSGAVLGTATVDAQGNFSLVVSGATAGQSVVLVQNGVRGGATLPALKLGSETAFTSANTFNPDKGATLDIGFKPLADDRVTVRIFNVAGDLVRPLLEMEVKAGVLYAANWNGKNGDGDTVAAGIYVISVHGKFIRTLKKVVVLR